MSKYLGQNCTHCNKEFVLGDDIVVCPDCGAPHHRACYKELGHCAQTDLHGTPEQYSIKESKRLAAQGKPCLKCGAIITDSANMCPNCGFNPKAALEDKNNYNQDSYGKTVSQSNFFTYGMMHPDETIDGISAKEFAIFVGQNSPYFLTKFKMMSGGDKRIQVNFAAFIFNFVYFFYRKMYKIGAALLAVFILTSIPGFLITGEYAKQVMIDSISSGNIMGYDISDLKNTIDVSTLPKPDLEKVKRLQNIQNYTSMLALASSVFGAFFANKAYYNHCISKIRYIRAGYNDYNENKSYYYSLSLKGRVNTAAAVGLILMYFFANFMVTYMQISTILGM